MIEGQWAQRARYFEFRAYRGLLTIISAAAPAGQPTKPLMRDELYIREKTGRSERSILLTGPAAC